ncbi:MAG: serine/threonine-protein kinase [Nannocystaceae bacterium]
MASYSVTTTVEGPDRSESSRPAPDRPLLSGQTVGRYMIVQQVGSGGMGVVYAAYDGDLDRRVALKLLQPSRGPATMHNNARMVREAQALARLAHPNVVAVYEVGDFHGRPFVAMEFVNGPTMAEWTRERPRPWRESVAICVQAGRGLAAAHEQGIVHRDFKPHNVILGSDGRARVVDFGLAKGLGDASEHDASGLASSDSLSGALTQTGQFAGTPPYMAPEQFRGEEPDPRTDQYAFCVTLWEMLYGERPFAGRTRAELEQDVCNGVLRDPPRKDVPAFLRRALYRGLSVRREQRFDSMGSLLDAIDRDPVRTRRMVLGGGAGVTLVAALSAWAARQTVASATPCDDGPARLSTAWSGDVEHRLRTAFDAVDAEFAGTSLETVTQQLDDYAERWLTQYRDACEATHVHRTQSAELLDLRMACLDQRRSALAATTSLLADADREAVARSVQVVTALPSAEECARSHSLMERNTAPVGEAAAREAEGLRDRLARASALGLTGRADEGLTQAQSIHARAVELGHGPLRAEASLAVGVLATSAGQPHLALQRLHAAVDDAIASGHDEVLAVAAIKLIHQIGVSMSRYEDAERWARLAAAAVERRGGTGDEAIDLEAGLCSMRSDKGDTAAALPHCNAFRDMATERYGPEHPTTARALRMLANTHGDAGNHELADRLARRGLELFRASYGTDHPEYPTMTSAVAVACYGQGRGEACIPLFQDTVEAVARSLGPEHPMIADARNNLATLLSEHGRLDEAKRQAEQALRLRRAQFGDDHPGVGASHRVLATIALQRGARSAALEHADRAVEIMRATRGEVHPDIVAALRTRAPILLIHERIEDALADRRAALEMVTALERPLEQWAPVAFELARDLAEHRPESRDEARRLATRARDGLSESEPDQAETIDAWLQAHDGPGRP